MRLAFLGLILLLSPVWAANPSAPADLQTEQVFNKIPLRFEAVDQDRWLGRGLGFGVGVTGNGVLLGIGENGLRFSFEGALGSGVLHGENKSKTPNNYFKGDTLSSQDVFLKLRRTGLYPGVDVVYYGQGQGLEYDFELAPGADPSPIRMRFDGAASVRLGGDGSLILGMGGSEVVQKAPVTYQRLESGGIVAVASSYYPEDNGSYSIRLGAYDGSEKLVIDPQVILTAYLAGDGVEEPLSVSRDRNGFIYVVGRTFSNNFPITGEPFEAFNLTPNEHVFTTKVNPLGIGDAVITYSGFFGGEFGDIIRAAVVDPDGVLYMTGMTDDFFFPVRPGAFRDNNGGVRRSFFSVLDTRIAGKAGLVYSTFFGGSSAGEEPTAITLANGKAYITGFTAADDFPVKNFIQEKRTGNLDGFVAEFDISKTGADSLVNSTYLGGVSDDIPRSIAVDSLGKVYVAGRTSSNNFPTTANALKPTYGGQRDGFLVKYDLAAARIDYSTYFGTSSIDEIWKVMIDPTGRVAIGGFTLSNAFPVTANAMQPTAGGGGDAFLSILDLNTTDLSKTLAYSTYYGGNQGEVINDIRSGPSGAYYLCGYTLSRNLPVKDAYKSASAMQSTDGFIAIIDPAAPPSEALILSTYITGGGAQEVRGVDVDAAGVISAVGYTDGNVFFAGQGTSVPKRNVFLLVFKPTPPAVVRAEAASVPSAAKPSRARGRER